MDHGVFVEIIREYIIIISDFAPRRTNEGNERAVYLESRRGAAVSLVLLILEGNLRCLWQNRALLEKDTLRC